MRMYVCEHACFESMYASMSVSMLACACCAHVCACMCMHTCMNACLHVSAASRMFTAELIASASALLDRMDACLAELTKYHTIPWQITVSISSFHAGVSFVLTMLQCWAHVSDGAVFALRTRDLMVGLTWAKRTLAAFESGNHTAVIISLLIYFVPVAMYVFMNKNACMFFVYVCIYV